jgi:TRAP-type C4-dicarboxylate transport system permease small subunit
MKSASERKAKPPEKKTGNIIQKWFSRSEEGIWKTNRWMVYLAAVALFGMMAVTVADIIGRYFFNKPITGAYEIVGFMLAMASAWGMGYCQVKKGHIRVDFLFCRFPKKVQALLTVLSYLIGLGIYGVLCWRVILVVQYYLGLKHGFATDTLGIPIFPFVIMLAIGSGMLALVILFDLIRALGEVKDK